MIRSGGRGSGFPAALHAVRKTRMAAKIRDPSRGMGECSPAPSHLNEVGGGQSCYLFAAQPDR